MLEERLQLEACRLVTNGWLFLRPLAWRTQQETERASARRSEESSWAPIEHQFSLVNASHTKGAGPRQSLASQRVRRVLKPVVHRSALLANLTLLNGFLLSRLLLAGLSFWLALFLDLGLLLIRRCT